MEWKAAGGWTVLLIDSMGLTGYRGRSLFFAVCTHWLNILQHSHLSDVYSDQKPLSILGSLHHSLSLSLGLYQFLSKYFSQYLPSFPFYWLLPPTIPLSLSCWPDCCRALREKKKHSEIWHCIIMPQTSTYHSLTAPLFTSSPPRNFDLVSSGVYWPCDDPCQTHAHFQLCVKPVGIRMLMFVAFKPQKTAVKECKSEMWSCTLCLVCTSIQCCKHSPKGIPVEMALLWVRRGKGRGAVLPSGNTGSRSFMHPCEGDSAALGHLLRALSPVYPMVSPQCWSVLTFRRSTYTHKHTDVPVNPLRRH